MLLLLHALIPCVAAYRVTHVIVVACPLVPVLLLIYYTCFSTFWLYHPYIPQHFNEYVFALVSLIFVLANTIMLFACVRATPLLLFVVI